MCNPGAFEAPPFSSHESGICTQMHDHDDGMPSQQLKQQEMYQQQLEQEKPQQLRRCNPRNGVAFARKAHLCNLIERKVAREGNIYLNGTARSKGSSKPRILKKKVCITISDDEPDEELGKMGDDWSIDLWDELVKNKQDQWDIRDALKHGKNHDQGDPSSRKGTVSTGRKLE